MGLSAPLWASTVNAETFPTLPASKLATYRNLPSGSVPVCFGLIPSGPVEKGEPVTASECR